jgi:protein-disulfide isomerase
VQRYVEKGTLRLEWRDFPYLGRQSVDAAVAARAAQAQGGFWEYHDLLYHNQSGGFSEEKLVDLARRAGLDLGRFREDLRSRRYERAVVRDFQEGQRTGVSGTPTFVINGHVLAGLQPVGVFENAIENAKREADGGA